MVQSSKLININPFSPRRRYYSDTDGRVYVCMLLRYGKREIHASSQYVSTHSTTTV